MNSSSPRASVSSQHSQYFHCPFIKGGRSRVKIEMTFSITYHVKAIDLISLCKASTLYFPTDIYGFSVVLTAASGGLLHSVSSRCLENTQLLLVHGGRGREESAVE